MLNVRTMQLGPLTCHVAGEESSPELVVVLCHGFGAPGSDLVPLAPEIVADRPEFAERVQFVFPEAPLSPPELAVFGGRAWWELNVARLAEAIQSDTFDQFRNVVPPGLAAARQVLDETVDAIRRETDLPESRLLLGGFSQGAMVTTDLTLRMQHAPAGLCIFSGTLICEEEWRKAAPQRRGLPVLQTHGRRDPLLPFSAACQLRDLLIGAGLDVEFVPFDGEHTIPREGIQRLANLIDRLLEPAGH